MMSVFHDIAAMSNVVQPISALSSSLSHTFILVKFLISIFGTITILIGAMIAIYRYVLYRCGFLLSKMPQRGG